MYDVIIIGAGVTGCAVARELSKYEGNFLVVERMADVCEGTSKANSGIVHAGFDAEPGSLKAKLNVEGNEKMEELSRLLDFPFERNGSLILCFSEEDRDRLLELKQQGIQNGVKGLSILSKEEIKKREPNISGEVVAALYAPTGGIVCPFTLTLALAENANDNGVAFQFETEILSIEKKDDSYLLHTTKGDLCTKAVVNAAGVYADTLHNMVSDEKIHIIPRKGEYCLFDKMVGDYVSSTLFQLPTRMGKGVLVTKTVHGNLLVGPTALDIMDKEGVNTTKEGIEKLLDQALKSVEHLPARQVITSFAGLRAHEEKGDFIIEEVKDAKGFITVAGIESPGLTCAPAIGGYVANILEHILTLSEKKDFIKTRQGIPSFAQADFEEREELIEKDKSFANVICRCELVTEGEIIAAIRRPLGAKTLDGIKRRTRAGMGRCQAGFCMKKTMEILARELSTDLYGITKSGSQSVCITGQNKEDI